MHNLSEMLAMVNKEPSRLMPHVKTNKMPKVIERMVRMGIKSFKSSTIAEAEMAAQEGAEHVLIAHQLVGPKIQRFGNLIEHFPKTSFSTIIDNLDSLNTLNDEASRRNIKIIVFIDINNGMDRSGIEMGDSLDELIDAFKTVNYLIFKGLHVYDGHIRDSDYKTRKSKVEDHFKEVNVLFETIRKNDPTLQLICGGTPTFTSHLIENGRICSPGTCVFWDWGYAEKLSEQDFKLAALLVTRVISKPTKGVVTIDLGHKGVAAENPIDKRVKFLNLKNYRLRSQSEEHGVLEVQNWDAIHVGDVFFGIPFHICPTVNLYDEISVIVNGRKKDVWEVKARRRKISI